MDLTLCFSKKSKLKYWVSNAIIFDKAVNVVIDARCYPLICYFTLDIEAMDF
jgi:hypothetical protein